MSLVSGGDAIELAGLREMLEAVLRGQAMQAEVAAYQSGMLRQIIETLNEEPERAENDLAETLRALTAALQNQEQILTRLVVGVNNLPRELVNHLRERDSEEAA